jgi:hypothetical protein
MTENAGGYATTSPSAKGFCQPNRFIQVGFPSIKIGYSPLQGQSTEIRKNVIKNASFRPVREIPYLSEKANFEP